MKQPAFYLFLRLNKINATGTVPLYFRIIDEYGNAKESPTGIRTEADKFDSAKKRFKGNTELAKSLNHWIDSIRLEILNAHQTLSSKKADCSAQAIFYFLKGGEASEVTVLSILDEFIKQKAIRANKGVSVGRLNRYKVTRNKIVDFLSQKYRKNDFPVQRLNHDFIENFHTYLLQSGLKENTASSYEKILKKIGTHAFNNGAIDKNPFFGYRCTFKPGKVKYLTKEELDKLMKVTPVGEVMQRALDCFIFLVFTGLSFGDGKKLSQSHITHEPDGTIWIDLDRNKTSGNCHFPMLPIAAAIYEKYRNDAFCINRNVCLPFVNQQCFNRLLKILAAQAGIKAISSHVGRHTHATEVALKNGMPLHVLSSNLGHKSLRTTTIYAKIVSDLVRSETKKLSESIENVYSYSTPTVTDKKQNSEP